MRFIFICAYSTNYINHYFFGPFLLYSDIRQKGIGISPLDKEKFSLQFHWFVVVSLVVVTAAYVVRFCFCVRCWFCCWFSAFTPCRPGEKATVIGEWFFTPPQLLLVVWGAPNCLDVPKQLYIFSMFVYFALPFSFFCAPKTFHLTNVCVSLRKFPFRVIFWKIDKFWHSTQVAFSLAHCTRNWFGMFENIFQFQSSFGGNFWLSATPCCAIFVPLLVPVRFEIIFPRFPSSFPRRNMKSMCLPR